VISLLLSLTLSPAMALLLRGHVDVEHAHLPAGGGCCKRARIASTPGLNG
jgi:multidrug efflux pump subunit AcrB